MSAPIGNKFNEKWTLEESSKFFDNILSYIEGNKKCRALAEACVECGEYEELINYILNKFPEHDFKSIKRAKDIVKNRLVNQGLDGEANPTMAIFILKNNHGFKDRTDLTTDNKPLPPASTTTIAFVDLETEDD